MNTGQQGIYVFKHTGARAYMLSGTHRCNNNDSTLCKGTTTVCGFTKFRISDPAHNTSHPFQTATKILHQKINEAIIFQLHGFAKLNGDPHVILGNGTQNSPTSTDFALTFSQELDQIDTSLTFKIGHIDTTWTRLLGTVNVQGRLINGASDPCGGNNVNSPNGRFVHVEQDTSLRNSETGWNKVSNAIAEAVPLLPLSLRHFQCYITNQSLHYSIITHRPGTLHCWVSDIKSDHILFQNSPIYLDKLGCQIGKFELPDFKQLVKIKLIFRTVDENEYAREIIVQENTSYASKLTLSPNPANQWVSIKWNQDTEEVAYIEFLNQTGKPVYKTSVQSVSGYNEHTIHYSNLPSGWYWVQIKTSTHFFTHALIIF